jgi:hypothetical protein
MIVLKEFLCTRLKYYYQHSTNELILEELISRYL